MQETNFHAFSRANFQMSASDEASLFYTPAAALMFDINKAPSSMIRNERQSTEKGLFRMATQAFLLTLPLSVCPPQPRTPKSCFCTVWRRPTTSFPCSSRTQESLHCPTAQRSKFRCASARRTRCTAARPAPSAAVFSRCSPCSCSRFSVSAFWQTRTTRSCDVSFATSFEKWNLFLSHLSCENSTFQIYRFPLTAEPRALSGKPNLNLLWISHSSH